MSLVDRGDSRAVTYLGSCMLTTSATGVGAVQKPLRELYFSYRQSGAMPDSSRQRYLTMSSRGLTMSWKEPSRSAPTEVFYSMPNILFWDAVQFVVVKGTKKLCGAFEPLDNDHSRNKDNLFVVLEKKYQFLQQMRHPALFVCVLRRTTGVKAMDVHVFVCLNEDEALGLVHGLNIIQDSYNDNQVSETGAFSYKPFPTAGDSGGAAGSAVPMSRPVPGLAPPSVQHLVAQNAVAAAAAARESQAQARPPMAQIDHKSRAAGSSQESNVIKLSQDDFQQSEIRGSGSAERAPARGRFPDEPRIPEERETWSDEENVYQYIRHIGESRRPAGATGGNARDSRDHVQANSREAPLHALPYDRNKNRIPSGGAAVERNASERIPPREYESMTRSVELNQDTLSSTALRPSNIIARFEERSKATAAVRPQSIHPPDRAGAPKPAPKPTPSPVERDPSKLGQGYSFLSGSGSPYQDDDRRRHEYDNAPSPRYPRPRSPAYDRDLPEDYPLPQDPHLIPAAFYAHQEERLPPAGAGHGQYSGEPPRLPSRSGPIAADAWQSSLGGQYAPALAPARYQNEQPRLLPRYQNDQPQIRREQVGAQPQQSSPFDRPRSFGERHAPETQASRPVAKVTPHKVSGVGVRVLPPNPVPRPHSPGMPEEFSGGQPQRQSKTHHDEQKYQAEGYRSQEAVDNNPPNWKLKPNEQEEAKKEGKKGEEPDRNMSEKLLQSKKKDAEIASVMQNLHFDYDASTVTPGMPAGNNFEKSLGYFP